MNKFTEALMQGVATLFFQEGYSRSGDTSNLDYWDVNTNRCVRIRLTGSILDDGTAYHEEYSEDLEEICCLSIIKIDDKYTVKVVREDRYVDDYEEYTLGYIPINPSRLCWEEFPKCVSTIHYLLTR